MEIINSHFTHIVIMIKSMSVSDEFFGKIPVYHSVFLDWDNTARYKEKAILFKDISVDAYEEALKIAFDKLTKDHNNMIFVNAWNEWSEGAYLEPDKKIVINISLLREIF